MMLESKAQDQQGDEEEQRSWIGDDQACLRVDMAISATIHTANVIVQPVADKPADEWTDEAEEVEVAFDT